MTAQFQIVIRSGPNTGKAYLLEANEAIIGRDTANYISINDAEISRKHAKLTRLEQGFAIEDLGSTNGTFINGQRIVARHALRPGDVISLGENIALNYDVMSDPNATMVSSSARAAKAPKVVAAPPPPPPAYSGQVPAGPTPVEKPAKKRKSPLLVIGIIILVLVCLCAVFFLVVDQLRLWCTLFPFLFPGAC
jgi:hypothetical protein